MQGNSWLCSRRAGSPSASAGEPCKEEQAAEQLMDKPEAELACSSASMPPQLGPGLFLDDDPADALSECEGRRARNIAYDAHLLSASVHASGLMFLFVPGLAVRGPCDEEQGRSEKFKETRARSPRADEPH